MKYMDKVFYAGNTIFEAFVRELLSMPNNLLLSLYLVYPRYLFNMGPAYIFSKDVETLRVDGYSTNEIWGTPIGEEGHPSAETYSYKCSAGLKTLLVEYLLMQKRHLTGEEGSAKTREEVMEANGDILLLNILCVAVRSDPMSMNMELGEVVTCVYGPAVTYAFPDPLVAAYRHSVVHVSLISVLDRTALNW